MPIIRTHLLEESELTQQSGIISLTGGGGKTTLLFALGEGLSAKGHTVLATTTTRMFRPHSKHNLMVSFDDTLENTKIYPHQLCFAARSTPFKRKASERPLVDDQTKVYGYLPEEIDILCANYPHLHIIVEADGASRKPLKAPASHEPVIPKTTRAVIAVIGLSCFYFPFTPKNTFRTEEVAAITGLSHGQNITSEAVAKLLIHPEGLFKNTPKDALKFVFCNQADLPNAKNYAIDIGEIVHAISPDFLKGMYFGALKKEGLSCHKIVV